MQLPRLNKVSGTRNHSVLWLTHLHFHRTENIALITALATELVAFRGEYVLNSFKNVRSHLYSCLKVKIQVQDSAAIKIHQFHTIFFSEQ